VRLCIIEIERGYSFGIICIINCYVYFPKNVEFRFNTRSYWTKAWLRTPIHLRKTYNCTFILITLLHNTYQDFAMWMQMTLTRSVHLCCFLLIRHHHEMPILQSFICSMMSFMFVVGWLVSMQCAAILHTSSSKNLRSWRNCAISPKRESMIWKRSLKSMKTISFKVGHVYVVKPITVVMICETYLKGTIRLLLTFRKK
jgi:hypothetical protein